MKLTFRLFLALISFALLAACQAQTPPPQATASTPLADLPMNAAFQSAQPSAVPQALIDAADAEYLLLTNIYERVAPSVVNIEVVLNNSSSSFGDVARGSGFVYDLEGHIITNAHVANDTRRVSVTFSDGYIKDARVVGVDLFSDIAVLQVEVDPARLHPVTIVSEDTIKVGERAIAIGNPFGLASSMTVGIVSGLGRQLPSAELISNDITPGFQNPSIIQVDTDINPGNSGGPLLNSHGEVIGINTAIRTDSGIFEGVGFAVPASTLRRVVPELIAHGQMDYGWLGITSPSAEDGLGVAALAEPLGLPVKAGVMVDTIFPDSPASKAGLQGGNRSQTVRDHTICAGGDIIVAVNGVYVATMDELVSYLLINTHPGDTIQVLIVRGTETFEVPVTLEPRPTSGDKLPQPCGVR